MQHHDRRGSSHHTHAGVGAGGSPTYTESPLTDGQVHGSESHRRLPCNDVVHDAGYELVHEEGILTCCSKLDPVILGEVL